MSKANQFLEGEDAVSPVIGVILMVAITVILAAVIAAFVFGMGPPEQAPQASIRLSDVDVSASNITLQHQGGDPIDLSKTSLTVTQGDNISIYKQINTASGTEFNGGEILKIDSKNGEIYQNGVKGTTGSVSGMFTIQKGKEVTITMTDTVSGQIIADGKYRA